MNKAIPQKVKTILSQAVVRTLVESDVTIPVQTIEVATCHSYVSIPVKLAKANQIERALKLVSQIRFNICSDLHLPHDIDKRIRLRSSSTYLIVEVERDRPHKPTFGDMKATHERAFMLGWMGTQLVGTDLFENDDAGLACLGTTGSGKTNTIRIIAAQALVRGVSVYLIDYKLGKSFRHDIAPLCQAVAYNDAQAIPLLEQLLRLIDARNSEIESLEQPILIIFDEVYKASDEAQKLLASLATTCRSANTRLVVGSQRWGKEVLGQVKANFDVRIVHKVTSKTEAGLCTDMAGSGAEMLVGQGDALIVTDKGSLHRVQIANGEVQELACILSPLLETKKAKPAQSFFDDKVSIQALTIHEAVRLEKAKKKKVKIPEKWAFYWAYSYFQVNNKPPTRNYFTKEVKRRNGQGNNLTLLSDGQVKLVQRVVRRIRDSHRMWGSI
jgi:hypothetical protein